MFSSILPVCAVENFRTFFPKAENCKAIPRFQGSASHAFSPRRRGSSGHVFSDPASFDPAIVFQQLLHLLFRHICRSPWKITCKSAPLVVEHDKKTKQIFVAPAIEDRTIAKHWQVRVHFPKNVDFPRVASEPVSKNW